jgi:hypothetical protein
MAVDTAGNPHLEFHRVGFDDLRHGEALPSVTFPNSIDCLVCGESSQCGVALPTSSMTTSRPVSGPVGPQGGNRLAGRYVYTAEIAPQRGMQPQLGWRRVVGTLEQLLAAAVSFAQRFAN